jgi:hypothetical protein
MKLIKAIRPIWVGKRLYQPGELVEELVGEKRKKALADDQVVEVKEKKVKKVRHADR